MPEGTLREQVETLFNAALESTAHSPNLQPLRQVLVQARDRLQQPMRVAIVGLIKAGKSTMMNALLGEAVVSTGAVEATFNVNWLCWGDQPALIIHFKDGRPPEPKAYEELAALTLRPQDNQRYLLNIRYIEVRRPNPVLQTINLIDTPGLASHFVEDSKNTLEFLQLHGKELSAATEAEAANADAVLYLFSRGLSSADQAVVEEFLGPVLGRATPLNAIGVLTKADAYWTDYDDPMEAGKRIAQRLAEHPQVRQLFYALQPICGLLAFGAQTLTDEEFEHLIQLAQVPEERLTSRIRDADRFSEREYEYIPVPPAQRRALLARLGQYGVWLACHLIATGIANKQQLRQELLQRSGAAELGGLVLSHFGNRAFLIKLSTSLRQITEACFRERLRLNGAERAIVTDIAGKFEAIESQEQAFQELRVLRSWYEGRLNFSDEEVQQLLTVVGEHGMSCAKRLGLSEEPTMDTFGQLIPVAQQQLRYWQIRASDSMGTDRETLAAATVITRSYQRILFSIQEAQRHLDTAKRYLAAP